MEITSDDRVEEAYRRTHDRLWRALYAWSGDREVASDAEAEAFSQAIRRGAGIADVEAWVWRCAFRVAAGLLADRRRRAAAGVFAADQFESEGTETLLVEFLSQLSRLSDQQRAIVVLRHVGGFRSSEIADLLTTTPGSVRVQLHRAHSRLRHALEDCHD